MANLPNEVLTRISIRLQNELVLVAPVDTGRLRNSVRVTFKGNTLIITMVDYGMFVEFGTNRQRPNPFIRNTIAEKLHKIVAEEVQRYYNN
ncbi:MAG: HK97 gp10 family phage protein [Candidatus Heimdallarchaeota archaeon]